MSERLIELNGINKVYATDETATYALNEINLTINEGEYVSISGPSGCGKSTLLSLLGLLDVVSEGKYMLAGHEVSNIFNLISHLTVEENVELPLTYREDLDKNEIKQLVSTALEKVNMTDRASHFPSQLSGGQQQRVAVARAIAGKPAIILADEPTGNLDSKNADSVMDLLDSLHADGATICMVTHDPRSANKAQRVIEILDGRVIGDKATKATKHVASQDEMKELV